MKNKILNKYLTIISQDEGGGFNVSFPDFPGCFTCGETLEEANKNASEALSLWLESLSLDTEDSKYNYSASSFITFTQPQFA